MAHLNIIFITIHPFHALCPFLIYSCSFQVEQHYCFAAPVSRGGLLTPDVHGHVLAVPGRVRVPNCVSRGGSTPGLLSLPSSAPAPALRTGQDLAQVQWGVLGSLCTQRLRGCLLQSSTSLKCAGNNSCIERIHLCLFVFKLTSGMK